MNDMRKPGTRQERGSIMIALVLITIPLLVLVGSAITTMTTRNYGQIRSIHSEQAMLAVESGLDFSTGGDSVLAARRFEEAARGARVCGDLTMERKATTAECTSWLRARRLEDLDACGMRLEALQRQERRSDPGLNTLLALGAIAGDRPLPPFRVPTAIHPIVRASARAEE